MKGRKRLKWPLRIKIIYSIIAIQVILLGAFGAVTVYGQHLLNQMDYDDGSNVVPETQVFETDLIVEEEEESVEILEEADFTFLVSDDFHGRTKEGVYNILLLGEDHDNDSADYRGNTDAMIVATIDTNNSEIKLTSFMRDMYVQIPGYQAHKLNSAYATGGIQLLYETFVANFDLYLDGYILVNFSTFVDIVDLLGGVEIELSQEEAEYMNTGTVIRDSSQRNVSVGIQTLNGAQALGYSRIRYVGNNDYERTLRQRTVLSAVFEKFKSLSITEMISVIEKVLPYIKTDLTPAQLQEVAAKALTTGSDLGEILSYRIPADGTFTNAMVRGMSVLNVDFTANIDLIHQIIFGDEQSLQETDEYGDVIEAINN